MLIPRYTLRRLLLVMTGVALFSLVIAQAVQAKPWAIGLVAAVAGLFLSATLYACVFVGAWAIAGLRSGKGRQVSSQNPFRSASQPPQIIPPVDPE